MINEEETIPDDHFSKMYPRAIDEVWYKRAVEQHYVNSDSFVFSVPIDEEGADNTTLVTASRAIFIGKVSRKKINKFEEIKRRLKGWKWPKTNLEVVRKDRSDENIEVNYLFYSSGTDKEKAPAAVVGFQFQHTALQALFQNITFSCKGGEKCTDCAADSWACYLIDDNGYVIAAEDKSDAGKFFGELKGPIMSSLVKEGVFEKIRIFDYQAVCFKSKQTSNDGSILLTVRTFYFLLILLKYLWRIEYKYIMIFFNELLYLHV